MSDFVVSLLRGLGFVLLFVSCFGFVF